MKIVHVVVKYCIKIVSSHTRTRAHRYFELILSALCTFAFKCMKIIWLGSVDRG